MRENSSPPASENIMGYYIVTPNEAAQQKYLLGRARVRALVWASVFAFLTLIALVVVVVAGVSAAPMTVLVSFSIITALLFTRSAVHVSRASQYARHAAEVAPRWQPTIG